MNQNKLGLGWGVKSLGDGGVQVHLEQQLKEDS